MKKQVGYQQMLYNISGKFYVAVKKDGEALLKNIYVAEGTENQYEFHMQGYYRLGMALEQSGEYFESLVAFSRAMSLDSKNAEYLKALTDTSLKSSLKGNRTKLR